MSVRNCHTPGCDGYGHDSDYCVDCEDAELTKGARLLKIGAALDALMAAKRERGCDFSLTLHSSWCGDQDVAILLRKQGGKVLPPIRGEDVLEALTKAVEEIA